MKQYFAKHGPQLYAALLAHKFAFGFTHLQLMTPLK